MDDSSTDNVGKSDRRIPLGMGSFAQQEREQFGQNIRLAMECIEDTSEPVQGKARQGKARQGKARQGKARPCRWMKQLSASV